MDVSHLLDNLNDKQREAVSAAPGSMLVLAGAGSGKTRVLVHRIAWLMQVNQVSPYGILSVTFTNKAAAEMKSRVEAVIHQPTSGMWIGTFHSLAHRLLRSHASSANLPENFQILDSDDQYRLVKRILRSMNLDEKQWPPKQAQWYINNQKDEGLRPQHIDPMGDFTAQKMKEIYQVYQDTCDRSGLVDFAELLLRAHEMWINNPALLDHYRSRFQHILVDEFQDTNKVQYAWLRLLAGDTGNLMIVGDDDQSIYGWRGAKIENIQKFKDHFPDASTVRLEQNYRSTGNILKAANTLISNNNQRLGKELWTDGDAGEPISIYAGFNELDEARFIVARIREWHNSGEPLADSAILYRSNAQSRVIEEALLHHGIPYKIYGGLRFFERQEIKDALAYLRLISNLSDDAAFERVVNTPTRGIGDRTLSIIRETARTQQCSLHQAANFVIANQQLSGRAANAVSNFFKLIDELADQTESMALHEQTDFVIRHSGLYLMYQSEKGEKAQARIENLEELVTATKEFVVPDDEDLTPLTAFLTHASLEAGEQQADGNTDAVQMMTMHSAKGLEFPLVLLAGIEEGLFPNERTFDEFGRLEEERRLCYVAMTRAMRKLYICYAESRRLYGQEHHHKASRFIGELPQDCIEEVRVKAQVSRPAQSSRFANHLAQEAFEGSGLYLGQRVTHSKFGDGTVTNYEGSGQQCRVQVNFDDAGSKWLVAVYAKLQPI